MKKSFLMLGAALAALTSCTQSEVLEVAQSRAISFEPYVDRQTRTTDDIVDGGTNNDFKEFYVFGAKGTKEGDVFTADNGTDYYLNHVKVTGGKGSWNYEPHAAWVANKTFRFAAYANGKGDGSGTAAQLTNVSFVPEITEDGEHLWGLDITGYEVGERDLIAAVPEEKNVGAITDAPALVGLTFKHLLTKVIVQFQATNADPNLSMEISSFKFNAYGKGDCDVRYTGVADNTTIGAEWANQSSAKDFVFFHDYDWVNAPWKSGNIQDEVYVIPQSNNDIVIDEIVINTKNNLGEVTSTKRYENVSLTIAEHTEWKPGYVYRYVANLTPGQHYIHFSTSVTSWIDPDNRNQQFGN